MTKIQYTPSIGEDISTTITNSLSLSKIKNTTVEFTFNGIILQVDSLTDDHESVLNLWKVACKQRSDDYNNSEEGKAAKIKREEDLLNAQNSLDKLIPKLTPTISNKNLLEWLVEFTKLADYVGTTYDKVYVLAQLNLLGFEESMWVGHKGEWSLAHRTEYVVGQVITCILKMGAPHPMTIKFCEELLIGDSL